MPSWQPCPASTRHPPVRCCWRWWTARRRAASACARLYVRPAFRRFGLGRRLAEALLDEGQRAGYSAMFLDTLDEMEAARELYASLGFEEVPPYYYNPIPGAHYLRVSLNRGNSRL